MITPFDRTVECPVTRIRLWTNTRAWPVPHPASFVPKYLNGFTEPRLEKPLLEGLLL